ncbi:MAG TPA: enoyl-CoA hydratase/isomerase family protein [Methylomirabilota bacterium]
MAIVTGALVSLDVQVPVAWLRLERPHALNALNRRLAAELEGALPRVAALEDVTVVIVSGRGRAFCAGNDIAEMAALEAAEAEAHAAHLARVLDGFARLPQVTLAAIDGHALGGGLMLALAQDLRIASDRARFGFPEVSLGFNPGYGIARVLDVLGGAAARDLLLTGRTVHATEALRLGIVNRLVAAPTLEASAMAWATEIARAPREALAATKAIVADLREGKAGDEPARFGALLGRAAPARARLQAFLEGKGHRAAN